MWHFLCAASLLSTASAYPSGAGACLEEDKEQSDFVSMHGAALRPGETGGFSLSFSQSGFVPGCQYSFSLCSARQFKGLLLSVEEGSLTGFPGEDSADQFRRLSCGGEKRLTHINPEPKGPEGHFVWTAPATFDGDAVAFHAMIVGTERADWYSIQAVLPLIEGECADTDLSVLACPDHSVAPNNACDGVRCAWGSQCVVKASGQTSCECGPCDKASLSIGPVCGSNDQTYNTLCELEEDTCRSGGRVLQAYEDVCDASRSDPCRTHRCPWLSKCVVGRTGEAGCVCQKRRDCVLEEVCGTDGKTYNNVCDLEFEVCRTRGGTRMNRRGACPEATTCEMAPLLLRPATSPSKCLAVVDGKAALRTCDAGDRSSLEGDALWTTVKPPTELEPMLPKEGLLALKELNSGLCFVPSSDNGVGECDEHAFALDLFQSNKAATRLRRWALGPAAKSVAKDATSKAKGGKGAKKGKGRQLLEEGVLQSWCVEPNKNGVKMSACATKIAAMKKQAWTVEPVL